MISIEQDKINQLSVIIDAFLKEFDPAEFNDGDANGGMDRSVSLSDKLAEHLVAAGISLDY